MVRFFHGADDAVGVDRRDDDGVHLAGDEVLHLRRLPGQIPLASDDVQIDAHAVRGFQHPALQVLIENVGLGEQRDAHLWAAAVTLASAGGE